MLEKPSLNGEIFKNLVVELISKQIVPFRFVKASEFLDLLSYCAGGNSICEVPTDRTLGDWISERYLKEKDSLKSELQTCPGNISFTLDGWTSENQHAFLGIVANWVDSSWKLNICLLSMDILKGCHSGCNLAKSFCDTLEGYGLWDKLHAVTTDNAAKMDTFSEELEKICAKRGLQFKAKEHRVRCLAHIINLACKDVLNEIGPLSGSMTSYTKQNRTASDDIPSTDLVSKSYND